MSVFFLPISHSLRTASSRLLLILSPLLLTGGCASVSAPEAATVVHDVVLPKTEQIEIAAVGDIMLGTDYPQARLAADDGVGLLQDVQPVLQAADLTFGNLEGVLLEGGEPAKTCRNPAACYLFRSPPRYAGHLAAAGFDLLSLANNHARDFDEAGRDASMQALEQAGLQHSGRVGDIAYRQVRGIRVAMIAFAPFINSHDMLDLEAASAQVAALAADNDIVIVSMHAGAEGPEAMRLPFAQEFYHGEDRGDVVAFAHTVIDAGADLVLGHGPHVPRALELYQDRLIAYSLGNFCTFWGISIQGVKGLAPILLARLDANGAFLDGRIVSARQSRPAGTQLDKQNSAARMMAQLTREDFPTTPLHITSQGEIVRLPVNAPDVSTTGLAANEERQ